MKKVGFLPLILIISLSACGHSKPVEPAAQVPTTIPNTMIAVTAIPESTLEEETLQAIPTFTPLTEPCPTPEPGALNDIINNSITIADSGKTYITHVTARLWIYLDDKVYPLRDLMNSIPDGLLGYVSNGSTNGPQCYPVLFETVHPGKGLIKLKDFQLTIIVEDIVPLPPQPIR